MSVREIKGPVDQWQMDKIDLHRRMEPAHAPQEQAFAKTLDALFVRQLFLRGIFEPFSKADQPPGVSPAQKRPFAEQAEMWEISQ